MCVVWYSFWHPWFFLTLTLQCSLSLHQGSGKSQQRAWLAQTFGFPSLFFGFPFYIFGTCPLYVVAAFGPGFCALWPFHSFFYPSTAFRQDKSQPMVPDRYSQGRKEIFYNRCRASDFPFLQFTKGSHKVKTTRAFLRNFSHNAKSNQCYRSWKLRGGIAKKVFSRGMHRNQACF